jgi:hypothetical protein
LFLISGGKFIKGSDLKAFFFGLGVFCRWNNARFACRGGLKDEDEALFRGETCGDPSKA